MAQVAVKSWATESGGARIPRQPRHAQMHTLHYSYHTQGTYRNDPGVDPYQLPRAHRSMHHRPVQLEERPLMASVLLHGNTHV
ncbi:hypothetical protein Aduo_008355 [Ancylostoma duodenale]